MDTDPQLTAQQAKAAAAPPFDWIVFSANALGLAIVALAVFSAKADGVVQQVASSASSGAIF